MGKEVEQQVGKILGSTFDILNKVYRTQTESSISDSNDTQLLFPLKGNDDSEEDDTENNDRGDKIRVSEQELRFVFVEQLNKEILGGWKNVYYSVETPTIYNYSFGKSPDEITCHFNDKKKGRSGNIDLTIHDSNGKRIALIEFKCKNVSEHDFKKDFEKLRNEPFEDGALHLFVLLLNAFGNRTSSSIHNTKINPKLGNKEVDYSKVYFCAYSLNTKSEETPYVTGKILKATHEERYPKPFPIEENNNE